MLNAQFRRNLQQNQPTQTLTVRPELFISQADISPLGPEPRDVFVPRDPTLEQPSAPDLRAICRA
ncbi:MAG: hypothetical protein KF760_35065 [Candidatus Eremiobacteraeota bacterium]|nr:hypothetical protein [Candidatus Eremiobacteraeota bacterium]MCW5870858.1 hypothetical protein [Candidatus Eremiobacteraeota bacterium]